MAALVVVLVVMMMSPHPMGPSGCKEVKEDREVAKGVERQVAGCSGPLWEGREMEETPGRLISSHLPARLYYQANIQPHQCV